MNAVFAEFGICEEKLAEFCEAVWIAEEFSRIDTIKWNLQKKMERSKV